MYIMIYIITLQTSHTLHHSIYQGVIEPLVFFCGYDYNKLIEHTIMKQKNIFGQSLLPYIHDKKGNLSTK